MPLYFAYGANMDVEAMARRCPASRPLGPARLANHRFHIMPEGYASVRSDRGAMVHGLLWDLALADVPALDTFEEVEDGLYAKVVLPVLRTVGSAGALVYRGRSTGDGLARPGYLAAVLAAARTAGLPASYLREMAALARAGARGPAFTQAPDITGPVPGVRPRFATPFDRD